MTTSCNIAHYLPVMAEQRPEAPAVILARGKDRYEETSYQQLNDDSDLIARGLRQLGINKGTRTVVMVKPGPDFFSLVFALYKLGAVLVAVDPGMGIKNLGECLRDAEPTVFIGIATAHLARSMFRWAHKTLTTHIIVGNTFMSGKMNLDKIRQLGKENPEPLKIHTQAEDMAAILFTSGSTGIPKGAVYNHGNFIAQVETIRKTYDIQAGEIDMATFPLFGLFAPALGMTSIIPDMDFTRPGHVNPKNIIDPIIKFNASTMFGSPALLDRVSRFGKEHDTKLPTLKRVLSAGAPVSPAVLQRFQNMLNPEAQIFTPYGATESLPVSNIGSKEVLNETGALNGEGKGTCIGKPVENIEAKIIRITDDVIQIWSDNLLQENNILGEIVVKGPQVTASYFNKFRATELAKIPCADGGFFHRMGDLGYIDDLGRLWFCGRKSQRVITEKGTLFTIPCEGVFNTHPKVLRTALIGIHEDGKRTPALCIELEKEHRHADQAIIRKELLAMAALHEHTRDIKTLLFHSGFPVDIRHNTKIGRESLANWARKQLP